MTYNDASIEARLFFKIVETSDYSLLGYKSTEENYKAFVKIYDEYYQLTESPLIKLDLDMRKKISLIEYEISALNNAFDAIINLPMTIEQRLSIIDSLKALNVKIDTRQNIIEQVEKIRHKKLGSLKTKLNLLVDRFKKMNNTKKMAISFDKMLVNIENVLSRTIDEDVSLRKFIALEQSVKEKIAAQKNKK